VDISDHRLFSESRQDMQIRVKLFALLREQAGADTLALDVMEGATVAQALTTLRQQYPVLAPHLTNVRLALGMDFVEAEARLVAGDELTLIPPVSGGN
jgi:molybdopterin converting factor subunit 1